MVNLFIHFRDRYEAGGGGQRAFEGIAWNLNGVDGELGGGCIGI